jgi:hypothetical protein
MSMKNCRPNKSKTVLVQDQRPHPRKVQFALIVSKGPRIDVTNERIYQHVEFP